VSIYLDLFCIMIIVDFISISTPLLKRLKVFWTIFVQKQEGFKETVWINLYEFANSMDKYIIYSIVIAIVIVIFNFLIR
jgi:hypothetical protein